MDIQTREALITEINNFKKEALKMHIVEVLANTYEHSSLFDCNIDVDGSVIWYKAQARQLWGFWQAAKAQKVPEGFVLAPIEDVKTWYLDDDESIYREDPDWLCNTPVGEVVEVERRISYELDQAPVFAAITWDEDNQDVGYYETFATKDEAEKAAAHCKAMIEAQEQSHD